MRRRLLHWLCLLLVIGMCCLQPAHAQQDTRLNTSGQTQAASDDPPGVVFSFFIAISSTILILFTLLKPTRRHI